MVATDGQLVELMTQWGYRNCNDKIVAVLICDLKQITGTDIDEMGRDNRLAQDGELPVEQLLIERQTRTKPDRCDSQIRMDMMWRGQWAKGSGHEITWKIDFKFSKLEKQFDRF